MGKAGGGAWRMVLGIGSGSFLAHTGHLTEAWGELGEMAGARPSKVLKVSKESGLQRD